MFTDENEGCIFMIIGSMDDFTSTSDMVKEAYHGNPNRKNISVLYTEHSNLNDEIIYEILCGKAFCNSWCIDDTLSFFGTKDDILDLIYGPVDEHSIS
jgi:hypothetical protein